MSAGFDRLGLNFASPLTNAGGMIAVTGSEIQNDGFQSRAIRAASSPRHPCRCLGAV